MAEINNKPTIQNQRIMSFFSYLSDNYELSKFVLPKKRPLNDLLEIDEQKKLDELMMEKDYYEINTIIKGRYNY